MSCLRVEERDRSRLEQRHAIDVDGESTRTMGSNQPDGPWRRRETRKSRSRSVNDVSSGEGDGVGVQGCPTLLRPLPLDPESNFQRMRLSERDWWTEHKRHGCSTDTDSVGSPGRVYGRQTGRQTERTT